MAASVDNTGSTNLSAVDSHGSVMSGWVSTVIAVLLAAAITSLFYNAEAPLRVVIGSAVSIVATVLLLTLRHNRSLRNRALGVLGLAIAVIALNAADTYRIQEERLASLREEDPGMFLAELKRLRGDDEWFAALEELDPAAYEYESAKREAERIAAQERAAEEARLEAERQAAEERLAAERERLAAERERLRDCEDTYTALYMAEQFVTDRLKAPTTADFPGFFSSPPPVVRYSGSCTHVVTSYVDAQNGFGAQIRTSFQATVQYVGDDRWRLLDLVW